MKKQIPNIGEEWPAQGGIYAGIIRDTETNKKWHLILANDPSSIASKEWGSCGSEVDGEFSFTDGKMNTQLLLAAEPENEICAFLNALNIEGHQDYYLPAQKELNLLYINLQDHCEKEWHWSSTQCSAHDAWHQDFGDGTQYIGLKDLQLAVRAVRRLPIE